MAPFAHAHPMLSGPVNSLNPRDTLRYARDFEQLELLGKGGFGSVYKARHKVDQRLYAVKQIKFTNRGFRSPLHAKVMREVKNMAKLDHPNVCRYHQSWFEWVPEQPTRDAEGKVRMPGTRVSVVNSSSESAPKDTGFGAADFSESRTDDIESSFQIDSELESQPRGRRRRRRVSVDFESIRVRSSLRQTPSPDGGSTIEVSQTTDISTASFDMAEFDIESSRKPLNDSFGIDIDNDFGFGPSIGAPHLQTLAEEESALSRSSNGFWSSDTDVSRERSDNESSDSGSSDSSGSANERTRVSKNASYEHNVLEQAGGQRQLAAKHSDSTGGDSQVSTNGNSEHHALEQSRDKTEPFSSPAAVTEQSRDKPEPISSPAAATEQSRDARESSNSSSSADESAQVRPLKQTREKSEPNSSPISSSTSGIQLVDIDAPHNVIRPLWLASSARASVKPRPRSAHASLSPRRAPKLRPPEASVRATNKHASSDESSVDLEECAKNQELLCGAVPGGNPGMRRSFSHDRLVQRRVDSRADSKRLLPYRSGGSTVQDAATRVKAQEASRVVNEVAAIASKAQYTMVLYIQTQLYGPDTLKSMLERRNRSWPCVVDEGQMMNLFCQLAMGLEHIHFCGVIHRDLKPENVLSTEERGRTVLKIGDFGLSKIPDEDCSDTPTSSQFAAPRISTSTLTKGELPAHISRERLRKRRHTQGVGTLTYSSPEQVRGGNYSVKTDIYSLGMILMEMLCPFTTAMERQKCFDAIRAGGIPLEFAERHPAQARLIRRMTSALPSQRPSTSDLLSDPDVSRYMTTMRGTDFPTPPVSPHTSPQISVMSSPPTSASAEPNIASLSENEFAKIFKTAPNPTKVDRATANFEKSPSTSFTSISTQTSPKLENLPFEFKVDETFTKGNNVESGKAEKVPREDGASAKSEVATSTESATQISQTGTNVVAKENAASLTQKEKDTVKSKSDLRTLTTLMSSMNLAGARDNPSETSSVDLNEISREDLLAVIMKQRAEINRLRKNE